MFWPVVIFMTISLAIGLYTYTKVRGSGARFAVCERSLPFIVVGTALMAQAVDGNSTLGAVSLTYTSSVWAGLMISTGLALSLVVVGRFLAAPLNRMNLLTLPEFFYRRYGRQTELLVSMVTIVSFLILIAGNLSAVAWVLSVVSGINYLPALVISALVIVAYTIAGGLYSAIWTDFFQEYLALVGFAAAAAWVLMTRGFSTLIASVPASTVDLSSLLSLKAGALVNWAGLVALVFGNAMALDFMERVFAARDGRTARRACYYGAAMTMIIGLCVAVIGIAGVAAVQGAADPRMVLPRMAVEVLPYWIGVLVFVGVLGASMSTANGAMLVISVVLAQNVIQRRRPSSDSGSGPTEPGRGASITQDSKMLRLARLMALPTAAAAGLVAYVRPEPGILLIVAFDIVFAGCVVPLFAGVYWPKANRAGAIVSIVVGTSVRLIAYFVTPAAWAGLDTLIPPALGAVIFYATCRLTWKTEESRHYVLTEAVQEGA
jgi:SSS family solute:Na+ symporter